MGLNLDLCQMLGLPTEIECPHCKCETATDFDDWDVECGNPNTEPGYWKFSMYCACCEHEWKAHFALIVIGPGSDKNPLVSKVKQLAEVLGK